MSAPLHYRRRMRGPLSFFPPKGNESKRDFHFLRSNQKTKITHTRTHAQHHSTPNTNDSYVVAVSVMLCIEHHQTTTATHSLDHSQKQQRHHASVNCINVAVALTDHRHDHRHEHLQPRRHRRYNNTRQSVCVGRMQRVAVCV